MTEKTMSKGVAMIELIFAIVIMGIVMMSAPMLISTAAKSGYVAIQQESINEAASQVNIILGFPWDESNVDDSKDAVVLATDSVVSDLNETTNADGNLSGIRVGTPIKSYRKYISGIGSRGTASPIGKATDADTTAIDDMDDFDGTAVSLTEAEAGTADYIETTTINISRTVQYMVDNETGTGSYSGAGDGTTLTFKPTFTDNANSTNIKRIQVTLTSTSGIDELEKTVTLHAFSSNIGSFALEER